MAPSCSLTIQTIVWFEKTRKVYSSLLITGHLYVWLDLSSCDVAGQSPVGDYFLAYERPKIHLFFFRSHHNPNLINKQNFFFFIRSFFVYSKDDLRASGTWFWRTIWKKKLSKFILFKILKNHYKTKYSTWLQLDNDESGMSVEILFQFNHFYLSEFLIFNSTKHKLIEELKRQTVFKPNNLNHYCLNFIEKSAEST